MSVDSQSKRQAEAAATRDRRRTRLDRILGGVLSDDERVVYEYADVMDFRRLCGLAMAKLHSLLQLPLVYLDQEGEPTDAINPHAADALRKLMAETRHAVKDLRDELQDLPDSFTLIDGFSDLPDATPEIPQRLDDLMGGVLQRRKEIERASGIKPGAPR